jgi:hydrogenase maturation protein HypF
MCPSCSREYHDSSDRRFHAQPNACFDCGPSVWLTDSWGTVLCRGDEAVGKCSALLDEGRIIAVKGIGGFHIACTPFSDEVVARLRRRKGRKDKPFAVMASSIEEAERMAHIPASARELMLSPRKPIVLCCRRAEYPLSDLVAPGQKTVGILLPYSPLHHLILEEKKALIMTSANFSDEPIVSSNEKALSVLSGIADFFLLHDREIYMAIDDSVAAPLGRSYFLLRRARGYIPAPMALHADSPVIFGAGAEMKSSFCVSKGDLLFPGQYLGDMKQRETAVYYGRAMKHFLTLYELTPEYLVHDLHPQFLSTATALGNLPGFRGEKLAVQHHHAHLAACLLENGVRGPAIGAIFDGTGYGEDGTVWGGEFLVGDFSGFSRRGHFLPSRLPGGDASVAEPWRYGLSLLVETLGEETARQLGEKLWPGRKDMIPMILSVLRFSPVTTSCGRFFDGVAALLGLMEKITFDGQAAMALEGIAEGGQLSAPFTVERREGRFILDWKPAVRWVADNVGTMRKEIIAGAVHTGLALGVAEICGCLAEETGIRDVALSGGVWQNRRLTATVRKLLGEKGLNSLLHRLVPPNDECVSVGQVAIGAERWKKK